MANQKVVKIINVKRSVSPEKKFEQDIYETNWIKNEAKLKAKGWLLVDSIEKIETIVVEDGKGITEVEVVEPVKEEVDDLGFSKKPLEEWTLEELKAECDANSINYHHRSKEPKLIELLKENK